METVHTHNTQGNPLHTKAVIKALGSYGNIENNTSIGANTDGTTIDVTAFTKATLYYQDSTTSSYDSISVYGSPDGANWVFLNNMYPYVEGSLRINTLQEFSLVGFQELKLHNKSATGVSNVYATLLGQ